MSCAGAFSSLTNKVFPVRWDAQPAVLRLPGPGTDSWIDRDCELANQAAAHRAELAPEVLAGWPDGVLVTARVPGRAFPSGCDLGVRELRLAARLLAGVHESRMALAGKCDPVARLDRYLGVLDAAVPPKWPGRATMAELRRLVEPLHLVTSAAIIGQGVEAVPCHGDPWPGNIVGWDPDLPLTKLLLIDWEFSGMGDPAWDLANFIVESSLNCGQREAFLDAYGSQRADPRCDATRIEAQLAACDALWAAWALLQLAFENCADDFLAYALRRAAAARARLATDSYRDRRDATRFD